jgi:hypothetical protein
LGVVAQGAVAHTTRDAGLNNLAALMRSAPKDLLPDRITTRDGYAALMK